MRICLVSREFAPFFGAGIGTYAALMARTWIEGGHDVTLITGPEANPTPIPGLEVLQLEECMFPYEGRDASSPGFLERSQAVQFRITSLLQHRSFDVIEFADYFAEGAFTIRNQRQTGILNDVRLVCRLHTPASVCRDVNEETWRDVEQFLLDHHEWEALAGADALISPSHALLKIVSDRLGPIEGQTRAVVPYPFDLDSVADLGEGRTIFPRPTVLCFGRLEKRKGVDLLVEAASAVLDERPDVGFHFVGGDTLTAPLRGSMRARLDALIPDDRRDAFTFQDAVPRAQLGRAIRGAEVVCFPSPWDNFPNALLEAMACGSCVVGSDQGGVGEVITPESGFTFPARDADALAKTLLRALEDPERRESMGAGAIERIRTYCDPVRVLEQWTEAATGTPRVTETTPLDGDVTIIVPQYPGVPGDLEKLTKTTVEAMRERMTGPKVDHPILLGPFDASRARSLNAALREATTTYVVLVDPGDNCDVGGFWNGAVIHDRCAFVTSTVTFTRGGQDITSWTPIPLDRNALALGPFCGSHLAIWRRDAILDVGGFDEELPIGEEWDLHVRLALAGWTSEVIPIDGASTWRHIDPTVRAPWVDQLAARIASKYPDLIEDPALVRQILATRTI